MPLFFKLVEAQDGSNVRRFEGHALAFQGVRQLVDRGFGRANQLGQQRENRCRRPGGGQSGRSRARVVVLLSARPLLLLLLRVGGQVDDAVPEASPGELLLPGQAREEVADRGAQEGGEFFGRGTCSRVVNQSNERLGEGTVAGESDGTIEP